jgi:hypothetical protein
VTLGDGLILLVLVAAGASALLGALRWLARAVLVATVGIVLLTVIAWGKGHPWVAPVYRMTHAGSIVPAITARAQAVLRGAGAVDEPADAPSPAPSGEGSPRPQADPCLTPSR